jgi:hypothetical protein
VADQVVEDLADIGIPEAVEAFTAIQAILED